MKKPSILFVCKHNTGRSQMAEAYLRQLAGDSVEVASAGTVAASAPDPGVVTAMSEDGIDIFVARPKLLGNEMVDRADGINTMGCDVDGLPSIDLDWGLPDPKGQPSHRVREIRDMAKKRLTNSRENCCPSQSNEPQSVRAPLRPYTSRKPTTENEP